MEPFVYFLYLSHHNEFLISLNIVWNMCEHLHYESVYFKVLHKEQEYYIQSGGSCSVNYY